MPKKLYTKYTSWRMLVYLFIIQTFIALAARSIPPLGVIIGDDLHLTMSQIGMLPAALFLGQSIVSMPAGVLTDKVGSRKMILMISTVLGGSFLAISFVTSFIFLLFLIVISGFAYGSSHPTTNRGIIYWFNIRKRGTAMGIKQMGVTLGSALAALALFPFASKFGWQSAFFLTSLSLLFVSVIIYILYDEPVYSSQGDNSKVHSKKVNLKNIISLLKHKSLLLITFSAMLLSGSQMILNTFIILFAHNQLDINLILSGVLLGVAEVGGSLGRVSWGLISDHFFKGKRIIVLLLISLLAAFASALIAFLPQGIPFYMVAIIVFIFGFGTSGFNGIWMNATTEVVHKSNAGAATGVSITFGSWGVIIFPPMFGFIVDSIGSYTAAWLFVTFLMVLSMLLLKATLNREY